MLKKFLTVYGILSAFYGVGFSTQIEERDAHEIQRTSILREYIPDEVLEHIFNYLYHPRDLKAVEQSCTRWQRIAEVFNRGLHIDTKKEGTFDPTVLLKTPKFYHLRIECDKQLSETLVSTFKELFKKNHYYLRSLYIDIRTEDGKPDDVFHSMVSYPFPKLYSLTVANSLDPEQQKEIFLWISSLAGTLTRLSLPTVFALSGCYSPEFLDILGSLKELKHLDLSKNRLPKDFFPPEENEKPLFNLTHLDLSRNYLEDIPLSWLTSLIDCDLSYNKKLSYQTLFRLSESLPANLKVLKLCSGGMKGTDYELFLCEKFPNLTYVDFSYNNLDQRLFERLLYLKKHKINMPQNLIVTHNSSLSDPELIAYYQEQLPESNIVCTVDYTLHYNMYEEEKPVDMLARQQKRTRWNLKDLKKTLAFFSNKKKRE